MHASSIQNRSASVRCRVARFTDHSDINALEIRNGLGGKSYDDWVHLWSGNPAYMPGWPIGWVMEDSDGRIVGSFGNIPSTYELNGRTLLAACGHSWVVDRKYRGYSALLIRKFLSQQGVELFLNTTATARAAAAFTASQASRAPVGEWDKSWFWITNYRGFATSFSIMKSARLRPIVYPLSAALFIRDSLTHLTAWNNRELTVTECTDFDDRFDAFWATLKTNGPKLRGVRTQQALRWHFAYTLRTKHLSIATIQDGSKLVAYSTFGRQDNDDICLKRVRLFDFQYLEGNEADLFSSMLEWACQKCRQERIHMLDVTGLSPLRQRVASKLGAHVRTLPSWMYFYKARDRHLARELDNPAVWDPTLFDGDATL